MRAGFQPYNLSNLSLDDTYVLGLPQGKISGPHTTGREEMRPG
jgi:hypothetical protein